MCPIAQDVRFNGRIHATPVDGSCGLAALLEAIRHLARSRGIQFVLPDDADTLRAQMVQHISENLDDAAIICSTCGHVQVLK